MIKYVQISPFYNGAGWYDKISGIFFDPKVKEYKIPEGTNCAKINTYIIKNLLIDTTHLHNQDVANKKANEEILEKSRTDYFSANMLLKEEKFNPTPKEEAKESVVEETVEEVTEIPAEEEVVAEEAAEEIEAKEEPAAQPKKQAKKKNKK